MHIKFTAVVTAVQPCGALCSLLVYGFVDRTKDGMTHRRI